MEEHNPYQAPAANLSATAPAGPGDRYTPLMIQYLRETKPWVRLLSVLGFIFSGLMVLGGLVVMVAGAAAGEAIGAGIGVVYLVLAGLYLLPLIHLHRYANAIGQAVLGGGATAVEDALLRQRSFWRTVGIMSLVMIGLYLLIIVVAMVAGMIGAMSSL